MTSVGWLGHTHDVEALVRFARPFAFGAAFVRALVGHRKDMIDYVVHVADKERLNECLLMGAARIWSCSTVKEVKFLLYAIQSLVDAGAESFQTAMQISCGDAVLEHWDGNIFMDKAKILQRLVVLGSRHLTADFFGQILLMICVTFLCKLSKCQEKVSACLGGRVKIQCTSGEHDLSRTVVQDMINVLSVVCKNGASNLISNRLLDIVDVSLEDLARLLHLASPSVETCSAEWPLTMLKFLFVDCGIKNLSISVTTLPAFQAARLNVLLPVLQCFLQFQCFAAAYVYLDMSITFCRLDAVRYLLHIFPEAADTTSLVRAVRAGASGTRGPPRGPEGVFIALHSNFLNDEKSTMAEAALLAELPETDHSVKMALRADWSKQAFDAGVQVGRKHFLNWMLVRKHTMSPLRVGDLPLELQVAIGYLPLYKECSNTPGSLLSQRQRGELVAALCLLYEDSGKFGNDDVLINANKQMLLDQLAARLPAWCCAVELNQSASDWFQ